MSSVPSTPLAILDLEGSLLTTQKNQNKWALNRQRELSRVNRLTKEELRSVANHHDRCEYYLISLVFHFDYVLTPVEGWKQFYRGIDTDKLVTEEAGMSWWANGFAEAWNRLLPHLRP